MLWFKQIVKQTVQSKHFLLSMSIVVLFIIGKGIYHAQKSPQTVTHLAEIVTEQIKLNNQKAEELEQQNEEETIDYYEEYKQHLLDEYQALTAVTLKLRLKNLDIATEMHTYYRLLTQEKMYSSTVMTDIDEELAFTEYLVEHHLPYMEVVYPLDNALFPFQVAQILFHFGTAFLLIVLFGLSIYHDIETEKFIFLYTLPIKRKELLKQYSWRIMLAVVGFITLFLISFIPLLIQQNWQTLLYPYVINSFGMVSVYPLWKIIVLSIVSWVVFVGLLHVVSLLLVKYCHSADQNVVVMCVCFLLCLFPIITTQKWQMWNPVAIIIQFEQWIMSPYTLGYAGIYSFLLMGVLLSIYQWHYLENCYTKQTYQRQPVHSRNKKYKRLPKLVSLLLFEWRKRFALQSTKGYLLILLLILGGTYTFIHIQTTNAVQRFRGELVREQKILESNIKYAQSSIEKEFLPTAYKRAEQDYNQRTDREQSFNDWLQQHSPETWDAIHFFYRAMQRDSENVQQMLEKIDTNVFQASDLIPFRKVKLLKDVLNFEGPYFSVSFGESTYLEDIIVEERLNEIEKYQLTPLVNDGIVSSIQLSNDYMGDYQISNSTLYSLYVIVQRHISLIIIIVVLLIGVVTLSDDYYPTRSIELLKLLPQNRINLYWQKIVSTGVIIIGFVLVISLGYVIISNFFGGWGEANYPILTFDSKVVMESEKYAGFVGRAMKNEVPYAFHFVRLGDYVLQFILLAISVIFFISSLMQMIGTIVKSRYSMLFLSVLVLIGGYHLSWQNISNKGIEFSPFLYLNIRDTLDAWLQVKGNNPAIHMGLGCLVLLSYSVIFLVVGAINWSVQNKHRQQRIKLKSGGQ